MSTKLIVTALNNNQKLKSQMSVDAWVADQDARGEKVLLFREYADGEHRANMTKEMRDLLRIGSLSSQASRPLLPRQRVSQTDSTDGYSAFTDNRMDNIIQTMVDRLEVKRIEDTETTKQKRDKLKGHPFSSSGIVEAQTAAAGLYQPPQPNPDGSTPKTPPPPKPAANNDPSNTVMPSEPKEEHTVNDWVLDVLKRNRFDALQIEVHEAAIRDADTFVLVDWDEEKQCSRFTHEPAYDGTSGMLVLYEKRSRSEIACAVKIWHITSTGGDIADTMRVNVYYPGRIEKFISENGQDLVPYTEDDAQRGGNNGVFKMELKDQDGNPYTCPPVVHFKNKAQPYDNYGRSEIDDAIPLQDALNRLMHSAVVNAELTAFGVRIAKGFEPPAGLAPGSWVVIGAGGIDKDAQVDASMMESGNSDAYLKQIIDLREEIDNITRTPNPKNMGGDAASGEALKQREMGLLGKIKRAQIIFGNAWEDVLKLAHAVESAYGDKPPPFKQFSVEWRSAEIRNQTEEVDNILKISSTVGDEMTVRLLANVYDWSEDEIQEILTKKQQEADTRAQMLGSIIPGFNGFNPPRNGDSAPNGMNNQQQMNPAA